MFFIHSNECDNHVYFVNDIDLGKDILKRHDVLSVSIVPNYVNKRIITAHNFFDKFSLYDFSGNLLSTTTLSGDSYSTKNAFDDFLNYKGHTAYLGGASNDYACYLTRVVYGPKKSGIISEDIIKVDWNGIPTAIIDTENPVIGEFYIDEENNLYAIVASDSDDNEYHIVRWKLPLAE